GSVRVLWPKFPQRLTHLAVRLGVRALASCRDPRGYIMVLRAHRSSSYLPRTSAGMAHKWPQVGTAVRPSTAVPLLSGLAEIWQKKQWPRSYSTLMFYRVLACRLRP